METKKEPTVPCRWCGEETRFRAVRECDNCWEIYHRAKSNLPAACKIVGHLISEYFFVHG